MGFLIHPDPPATTTMMILFALLACLTTLSNAGLTNEKCPTPKKGCTNNLSREKWYICDNSGCDTSRPKPTCRRCFTAMPQVGYQYWCPKGCYSEIRLNSPNRR